MKHTIKEINGTHVLFINDKPSECPFKTGMAGLDNFQRPLFINQHCQSQCPHFTMLNDNTIILSCAPTRMEIAVTTEPETKPTTLLKP